MNSPYEVQRTSGGLSIWVRDGIQTFTDTEALKLVKTILNKIELEPQINVIVNNYKDNKDLILSEEDIIKVIRNSTCKNFIRR